MPSLAEVVVNAVVGGDTYRDIHALEMITPTGVTLATATISNNDAGFADALARIAQHAPGPRVVIALEGTCGYGIGLNRALQAAGWTVIESEPLRRGKRRRGKTDPIDA